MVQQVKLLLGTRASWPSSALRRRLRKMAQVFGAPITLVGYPDGVPDFNLAQPWLDIWGMNQWVGGV